MYWSVGALPFVLLAALWPTQRHRRWFLQPLFALPRLAAVLAPVWVSHTAAHKLFFPKTPGLEAQTLRWAQDALRAAGIPFQQIPNQDALGYRWGLSPVFDAPAAILRAQQFAGQIPARVADAPQVAFARHAFVDPWVIPMTACLIIVLLVTGLLPSWLSPVARWRTYMDAESYPRTLQRSSGMPAPIDANYLWLLKKDVAAGRIWDPYNYPVPKPPTTRPVDHLDGGRARLGQDRL